MLHQEQTLVPTMDDDVCEVYPLEQVSHIGEEGVLTVEEAVPVGDTEYRQSLCPSGSILL